MDCFRMELAQVRRTLGATGCVIQDSTGQSGNQGDMLQMTPLERFITGGYAAQTKHHTGKRGCPMAKAIKGRPMLSITA